MFINCLLLAIEEAKSADKVSSRNLKRPLRYSEEVASVAHSISAYILPTFIRLSLLFSGLTSPPTRVTPAAAAGHPIQIRLHLPRLSASGIPVCFPPQSPSDRVAIFSRRRVVVRNQLRSVSPVAPAECSSPLGEISRISCACQPPPMLHSAMYTRYGSLAPYCVSASDLNSLISQYSAILPSNI